jgi:kynureninase
MVPIRASLEMFEEVGMEQLREKSLKLTGFLEFLMDELGSDVIRVITPRNPEERGCQLSISVVNGNKALHQALMDQHVITDWREPNVIRCAPTPFYNTFEDVYQFMQILKDLIKKS